ncbi:FliD family flagellar hook-associated protein [Buttiauxella noackiae ATCC 51607]|uniref:Flagellar hook-associated protein 2 n=1 Tax=Buttiauxella noackiae ATCC 51607 TaxID=1354255 RepID=A0A1B7HM61_9ENTR|nr:flagellar filament capping protein FliD [Buttiauxella noackiae]OAT16695.1 FliD family flagellar hook-associated protein [Buttiauxella noackiae ATCC 51607]
MTDISSIDPQTMAKQLAGFDVQTLQSQLKTQKARLTAQQNALKSLKSNLTDFRTSLTNLNKSSSGMLKTSASMSVENMAKATTTSDALKGTYNLFIEQLASSHQLAYDGLNDDGVKNATGTMTIGLGSGADAKSIDIDMDGIDSLAGLAKAINGMDDNPGVTASLVRTGGEVRLMLSSDKSGAENAITLSGDVPASMTGSGERTISKAQDSIVYLGDPQNGGMQITNSTNTLTNLIDGVTLELNQTHKTGDAPLRINVGVDTTETQNQVNSFVEAYNKLVGTLSSLTASGSSSTDRGAFAGDASISGLRRELNEMLRTSIGGLDITQFGLSADKDGKLTLDSDKLKEKLTDDPGKLNALFNGSDGLLRKMDKSLDKLLSSSKGEIKSREETNRRRENELTDRSDKISTRYDNAYNRYLQQFTRMQSVLQQMNNTASMFGLV